VNTSLFQIFKVGIGPSSSHTVGPMRAAASFVREVEALGLLERVARIKVELYGSLALTGKGHATDRAVLLGLSGETPDRVEPEVAESKLAEVHQTSTILLGGKRLCPFDVKRDLLFCMTETLPAHSNGMRFTAYDSAGQVIDVAVYYSIGGGFIRREGQLSMEDEKTEVRFPYNSARELLQICERTGLNVWEIALANETAWHSEEQTRAFLLMVWDTMQACMERGLTTEGILPGGLRVRRRAASTAGSLREQGSQDALTQLDWVNAYAMAVNEENACGGRVVTAPTNGAAGVVPAVGRYYLEFMAGADLEGILRYLLTAGAIGILYKENASISGAEVGCQGEVGVACSMAAGGLVAALGGTPTQIEHAAEIGMEHNLGMTCDPVAGLVQIPCIERNAMGAVKAINAARMAMRERGPHKISLDSVIETMYRTGLDIQSRYKETSLAGLALTQIEV
jgi:L-serine dehydratase